MTLRLVTVPTTFPITLAEAKTHLRVDHDQDDSLIQALIAAALAYSEKTTGRPYEPQTWELVLDRFPTAEIMVPVGPLVSVTSVVYIDADGAPQTVSSDDYEIDTVSADGWIVPSDGWPTPMATINAVTITFVAGSGTPSDVRNAILLMLGLWYDTRATAMTPAMTEIPMGAECLLSLHRRYYI